MFLLSALFKSIDFFVGPLCFIILLMVFSVVVRKYKDDNEKNLYLKAFYYKMLFTLAYTAIISYYYTGGDTELYYDSTVDLRRALTDNTDNLLTIYQTKMI